MNNVEGLSRTKENLPLPQTAAGITSLISRVLEKPYVKEIHIQKEADISVVWYRAPGDLLLDVREEEVDEVLQRIELGEYTDDEISFTHRIVNGSAELYGDGLELSHMVCNTTREVAKSLGYPNAKFLGGKLAASGKFQPAILGVLLVESNECPKGWVVLCGGTGPRLNSVTKGIKTNL